MKYNHTYKKSGFTLIELILVVTIMAIMAGAIVPNLGSHLTGDTIKNASQSLSYIIRYARSVAVEQSIKTKIVFSQESGEIAFMTESESSTQPGMFAPQPLPVAYPRHYQEEVKIARIVKHVLNGTQNENELGFNPDGSTSDTFIYLTNEEQTIYTIGVVGITGQIMVWDHPVESFYEE